MDAIKISIASLVSPLTNHQHQNQHQNQHQPPQPLALALPPAPLAGGGNNSSSMASSSHPHHLPIDYSLANFKPAIAADFPTPFAGQGPTCLQVRDLKGQHSLILQRIGGQQAGGDRPALEEALPPAEQPPVSAFKAVLPKKKNTDGE